MLNKTISKSVIIEAPVSEVWNSIVDPKMIKQYLFDTNTKSDWKEGSPIVYSGNYEGKEYEDKGIIKEIKENKILRHTYWSSMSGLPDTPENYAEVKYELTAQGSNTLLTVSQSGFTSQEACDHSEKNWEGVLGKLKTLVEKESLLKTN